MVIHIPSFLPTSKMVDKFVQILHGGHGHGCAWQLELFVWHTQKFLCTTVCTQADQTKTHGRSNAKWWLWLWSICSCLHYSTRPWTLPVWPGQNEAASPKVSAVEELTPFLVRKEDKQKNACCVKSWDTIEVDCVCRIPEVSVIAMIQCSNCQSC